MMSRQDYLDFMSDTWDSYRRTLNGLPEADQQRYAEAAGFRQPERPAGAHYDWWRETLRVVPLWARGESPEFDYEDFDSFEAALACSGRVNVTLAQTQQDFENLRGEVAALIAELPEESASATRRSPRGCTA